MRTLLAAAFFATFIFLTATLDISGQQPDPKKAKQMFDPPKSTKPDEAMLKQIVEKTELLRKAIGGLKEKKLPNDLLINVEIYLKAAENIVRFEEWYTESSGKWAIQSLDQGLARAKLAEGGKASWRESSGKWIIRAYKLTLDGSIQPYAVLLPNDYGKDPKKKWRLDIVLHGRDAALTEAKFIASHGAVPKTTTKDLEGVQLEVYGRGNNAYRWAGEADVLEAFTSFVRSEMDRTVSLTIDPERIILRGFSMGGAGTWHLGLHNPSHFAAIGPGAGFTTTHGYIGGLPKELPEYQEKCLRIYDAVDYAENAFNVPVVAYSGANDPQKAAADNIEKALKGFKEPLRFTHLVAPGLEHQMPKEWQDKAEAEFKKYIEKGRSFPERVRFVTHTTRYNNFGHGLILLLDHQYEKAVIDSHWTKDGLTITTENIAAIRLGDDDHQLPPSVVVDGQQIPEKSLRKVDLFLAKTNGKWTNAEGLGLEKQLLKVGGSYQWLQGPIDDAFTTQFKVVDPTGEGWHPATSKYLNASREQFAFIWDKYFRGALPTATGREVDIQVYTSNFVLFGDPESNPLIAKVLPKLPIIWTKEKLVVNDVEYDAKTHVPVLIYPNPMSPHRYVVLNSGHTFKEADLKGTNALLYPRLGDWAVIKPTPTAKDPSAYEVVAAGLFDEHWQFPKKK